MTEEKLLPCPFCGRDDDIDWCESPPNAMRCWSCFAVGPSLKNDDDGIKYWNARAYKKDERVERLEGLLRRMVETAWVEERTGGGVVDGFVTPSQALLLEVFDELRGGEGW